MSRRVLIVSYYFPPLGGVGSLRVTGHATHLPHHGWEPVVLAPRSGAYHRDEALRFPEDRVIRTRSLELSRLGKRALRTGGDDVRAADLAGLRRWLRQAVRATVYFPDSKIGWAPFALRAGRRAVRQHGVEAILSSSFPITAHVIARRIARGADVPWVAEFRDPWSEMMPAGAARTRAARLECSLAREASAVVMTSQSWAHRHSQIWGREVDVVPNGHDLDGLPPSEPPERFVIGYLGTYHPSTQAPLTGIWEVVRGLAQSAWVRVIGHLHPSMAAELQAYGLLDRVEVTGFIPNEEAVERLRECSIAVLAGPRDAGGILRGQVAGKVWEYLATDVPLLYLGDLEADVASVLRGFAGAALARPNDVDAIAAALREAAGTRVVRDAAGCSRRARAGELAAVLERVSGR